MAQTALASAENDAAWLSAASRRRAIRFAAGGSHRRLVARCEAETPLFGRAVRCRRAGHRQIAGVVVMLRFVCASLVLFALVLPVAAADPCCPREVYPTQAFRLVYQTVYDQQQVTAYRLEYETVYEEQRITCFRDV